MYGVVPTSQEFPNQLILQTGHRNAVAKTASCCLTQDPGKHKEQSHLLNYSTASM